jgi:hypothetical protein
MTVCPYGSKTIVDPNRCTIVVMIFSYRLGTGSWPELSLIPTLIASLGSRALWRAPRQNFK